MERLGRHARANGVAYVALFVALGGTSAYAANTIRSTDIVDGEVKNVDLGPDAVTSSKLANGSVQNSDLGPDAVTTSKIKAGNVGSTDLADGAVATGKLADGAVKNAKLADGAVGPNKLEDASVTPGKLSTAPAASVLKLAPETTHSAAGTLLHADYEFYDTQDLHSGSSENLTAPVSGTYVVSATVDWDPSGTGYRRTSLLGTGGGTFASVAGPPLPSPAYTSQNVVGIERLAAGQSVQVQALQGSGVDLSARIVRFEMTLVGGY
jgi:hypothetical protein